MKISTFFDLYCPVHETKDVGQIPLGVLDNGADASVITATKSELSDYHPQFTLIQKSLHELQTPEFWSNEDSDTIIAYPLQGKLYSPLLEKMKAAKKKVILKLDSDGRIGYPLQRTYHRIPLRERLTVNDIVSNVYWRFAPDSFKRRKHASIAAELAKQIELSDATVIESPEALANLNYFLAAWGRSDLISKTRFVPNPVTPEFLETDIGKKEKVVLSFGRWDDYRQKNTRVMVETAVDFLEQKKDYRFIIFGGGEKLVKQFLNDAPVAIRERIEVLGFVERPKIKELLVGAQMFFIPSRWESFCIAAAETLCTGCSVVGTPVESLRYLAMQGFSGTIAASFNKDAILAALLQDADRWDKEDYEPKTIAAYWRPKLDRRKIAEEIINLACI